MIRVDHATAELPGMQELARYLQRVFPRVRVTYIPYERPYSLALDARG